VPDRASPLDPTSLPDFERENPLHFRVMEALSAAGLDPAPGEDGDIQVRMNDQRFYVRCADDSVPPMLTVFAHWLLGENLPGDELLHLRAANAVTDALNFVKVVLRADHLAASVDLAIGTDMDLRGLLTGSLDAVSGAVHTWHATVLELESHNR